MPHPRHPGTEPLPPFRLRYTAPCHAIPPLGLSPTARLGCAPHPPFKPLCLPRPTAGSRVGIQTTAPVIASELLLVSEPLAYTTAPAGTELRPVDLLKELQAKQPLPPADK